MAKPVSMQQTVRAVQDAALVADRALPVDTGPVVRAAVTEPERPGAPLSDPYVRRNVTALAAIEIASGALTGGDNRIYPALCRRGLVWEEPAGCWHLTDAGYRALAAWDAERAAQHLQAEAPRA